MSLPWQCLALQGYDEEDTSFETCEEGYDEEGNDDEEVAPGSLVQHLSCSHKTPVSKAVPTTSTKPDDKLIRKSGVS